jgi:hypothetical protein
MHKIFKIDISFIVSVLIRKYFRLIVANVPGCNSANGIFYFSPNTIFDWIQKFYFTKSENFIYR